MEHLLFNGPARPIAAQLTAMMFTRPGPAHHSVVPSSSFSRCPFSDLHSPSLATQRKFTGDLVGAPTAAAAEEEARSDPTR
jgi:hypothetical protein